MKQTIGSDGRTRYAAPAAACAVDVLAFLGSSSAALSLSELERGVLRSKSLIFRVLRELEAGDMVDRDASGRYRLGLGALEIGAASLGQRGFTELVGGILQSVADESGETVSLGVLRGSEVLYLMKFQGPNSYITISRVGGRVPATCVAIGKVLLAQLSESDIRAEFGRSRFPRMTPKSVSTVPALLDEIHAARINGFAIDKEQAVLGRCGIAVALQLRELGETAALSISTSIETFDARRPRLLQALIAARDRIERDDAARNTLVTAGARDRSRLPDALGSGGAAVRITEASGARSRRLRRGSR